MLTCLARNLTILPLTVISALGANTPMNTPAGIVTITSDANWLRIEFAAEGIGKPGRALFAALDTDPLEGCAVIPYQQHAEGSTVFLPFRADRLCAVCIGDDGKPRMWWRKFERGQWSGHLDVKNEFKAERIAAGKVRIQLSRRTLPVLMQNNPGISPGYKSRVAVWAKDTFAHGGWGEALAMQDHSIAPGGGDRLLSGYHVLSANPQKDEKIPMMLQRAVLHRYDERVSGPGELLESHAASPPGRPRIYQLLPRLFSNANETRKLNGTLAENGVGKFAGITDAALKSLRDELGITHLWLTGVLAQATSTDYAAIGKPADDPDLLKGLAGSPYAIKDYGDVCPDYAVEPAKRMEEFRALLERAHSVGLRVLIDFVPNHVARSHAAFASGSAGVPPEPSNVRNAQQREGRARASKAGGALQFGANDARSRFFAPNNNFFWLQCDTPGGGPPLRLPTVKDGQFISPTCRVLNAGDGHYDPEMETARVTGNNAATWSPSQNDWYETVKLNYGYDFTTGAREYPHAAKPDAPVPNTWVKMDTVLAHWQALGVDGFRCDMAHMVPPEFWAWAISRARQRQPGVMFIAEAYNNDPMKVEGGHELVAHFKNVMIELLNAGFDAVYDDPAYKALKHIYDGPGWANDLDAALAAQQPYVFPNSLRYAENHDEVRLASKSNWGGIGAEVGRPVSAILYGISRGPVLLYSGQEVGEPADGSEGFGGDDGRTTIFDYWSMPEFTKWVNGHRYDGGRLSAAQKSLREFYGRLMKLCGEPAFRDGGFFPLNSANISNDRFGRLPGEGASGHWLYACIRADARGGQCFLVVANLHRSETLRDARVNLTPAALEVLAANGAHTFTDKLSSLGEATLRDGVITLPMLPPLSAGYFGTESTAR